MSLAGYVAVQGVNVIVQSVTKAVDSRGGLSKTWAQFASLAASVNPLSGTEKFIDQRLRGEVTAEIILPYQAGVNEAMNKFNQTPADSDDNGN